MELVRGTPITDAAARLAVQQRLALMARVCDAVHHAHLNGVVHRDLKPANILVDDRGKPRVLDFGVSKLMEGEGDGQTSEGWLIGTPAYMSPEQLAGDPAGVDHRADVYALSVLLYELLAGRRPVEPEGSGVLGVARSLERRTVPSLAGVDRRFRGDLDTIARAALEPDRARRYQSAAALAEDLRRFIESRPIIARPPTRLYVAGRFVRRNPWPVALAAAAALALVAGSVGVAVKAADARREAQRAERHFNEVRELARTVLFDLHDEIARLPGSTAARRVLAETARDYLDGLASDPAADDALLTEAGEAYVRLGQVLGHLFEPNLGDMVGARACYDRALEILGPLHARHPDDARVTRAVADAHYFTAYTWLESEQRDSILSHGRRALELRAMLAHAHPRDAAIRAEHVRALCTVAIMHADPGERVRMLAAAVDEARAVRADHASEPDVALAHAEASHYWAYWLDQTGDLKQAAEASLESERVAREAVARWPDDSALRHRLSSALAYQAGIDARSGDTDSGRTRIEEAVAIGEALLSEDPLSAYALRTLSVVYAWCSDAWLTIGENEALASSEREHALRRALADRERSLSLTLIRRDRGWLPHWEEGYVRDSEDAISTCRARLAALEQAADPAGAEPDP